MSVENRDLRCYVTQVGFNQEALDKQLGRSTDLTHLVIDGTLLPDGSSPSALTDVQNEVKRYQLSRVEVDAQNASMLIAEAIIPADDGGFTINGIGIETSLGVLYAYARGTGDYKPLLEAGQGSDLVMRVQFLPGNADQITLQVDPTAVLATVDYVDQRTQQATEVVAGTAKVATQIMVDAGVDDQCMVTSKKLAKRLADLMVGEVAAFATNSAPTGWLKCNGAELSRMVYADLFAVIGTTFGAGDGATTFGLPDLRGEFVRGFDDGRGIDGGRAMGSAQSHAVENHNHTLPTGSSSLDSSSSVWGVNDAYWQEISGPSPNITPAVNEVAVTGSSGYQAYAAAIAGQYAAETRPRNVALLFCIKY